MGIPNRRHDTDGEVAFHGKPAAFSRQMGWPRRTAWSLVQAGAPAATFFLGQVQQDGEGRFPRPGDGTRQVAYEECLARSRISGGQPAMG